MSSEGIGAVTDAMVDAALNARRKHWNSLAADRSTKKAMRVALEAGLATALVAQEAEIAAVKQREAQLIADCQQELREAYAEYLERAEASEAEIAALRMALAESRLFVSAVAGENRPDRTWAVSLLGQIDAVIASKEG